MTLNLNQVNTLLPLFINAKYPGWRNIGTHLLLNGSCIVAGTSCIWIGGVGNFIKVEPTLNAVDCSTYTLDIEEFVKSKWIQTYLAEQFLNEQLILEKLENEVLEQKQILSSIKTLQ